MKQFIKLVKAILILLFIILLPNCQEDIDNNGKHDLYIGVIIPLDFHDGIFHEEAIRTAINLINDAGGANGFTLKLDVRTDDPSGTEYDRKDQAANVAKAILSDHSHDLIGFITAWSSASNGVVIQVSDIDSITSISGIPHQIQIQAFHNISTD